MTTPGSIYQAKNKKTGKLYIGQTQDTKERNGVPYRYGMIGRWSDHLSSAFRGAKTPLAKAILEHGADEFDLTILEDNITSERLDEREAHWIEQTNSVVPFGYNVMKHSRCKHRKATTLAQHYLADTIKVRISSVNRNGALRLVHVYLDRQDNPSVRLVFGQGKTATYEEAVAEAEAFAAVFAEHGIDVVEEVADDPLRKYHDKIEPLRILSVESVRIADFNELIALYAKHSEGVLRICFGGKNINKKNAYKTATEVKNLIIKMHPSAIQKDTSEFATGGCSSR